jgi:hypothetical protein
MTSSDLERLTRWELSGAAWRVDARSSDGLVIALLTCDAGEQVDRLETADPGVLAHVGDRLRSTD